MNTSSGSSLQVMRADEDGTVRKTGGRADALLGSFDAGEEGVGDEGAYHARLSHWHHRAHGSFVCPQGKSLLLSNAQVQGMGPSEQTYQGWEMETEDTTVDSDVFGLATC